MLQSVSAFSTTDAEYMALMKAAKKVIWLKGLVNEIGLKKGLTKVKCDSQSAICLLKSQMFHVRMKHIEVRYHWIRDRLNTGEIEVENFHMDDNAFNLLTKSVTMEKFKNCLSLLNLKTC